MGKATLEGIDSDNDGVRDDLQRYISIEYQASEKTRRVLTDMAKADQGFLLNADDKDKVLEADEKSSKAQDCSWYIEPETVRIRHKKLKAELLNTEERIRAYIKADSQLGMTLCSVNCGTGQLVFYQIIKSLKQAKCLFVEIENRADTYWNSKLICKIIFYPVVWDKLEL